MKKTFYKNVSSGFLFSEDDWSFQFDIAKGKTYPRVECFCKNNCLNNYNIGNDRQANSKLWPNSSNLSPIIENDAAKLLPSSQLLLS